MTGYDDDYDNDLKVIGEEQAKGHSYHCACRIVWGDGECECGKNPFALPPGKMSRKIELQRRKSGIILV